VQRACGEKTPVKKLNEGERNSCIELSKKSFSAYGLSSLILDEENVKIRKKQRMKYGLQCIIIILMIFFFFFLKKCLTFF
jgi:hypothetical protein